MGEGMLDQLEERVQAAAERIKSLKRENAALAGRVDDLVKEATEREAAASGHQAWEAEREEIRRRVEKLTATLEGLLED